MNKKIVLFLLSIIVILQPLSLNFTFAAEKSVSLEDECGCEKKEVLNLKESGIIKDTKVINNVKKSLRNNTDFAHSKYKQSDFDWKSAEYLNYGEEKNGLIVPFKKNSENFDVRLLTAYNKSNQEVSEILIMTSILTGDTVKTSYMELNGEEFVNFIIDAKTLELIDVKVSKNDDVTNLINVNKAAASYPSRVVDCVKDYWNRASGGVKTFCSAACGSVIFGGNALSVAMCASCLGASAMSCLIKEA